MQQVGSLTEPPYSCAFALSTRRHAVNPSVGNTSSRTTEAAQPCPDITDGFARLLLIPTLPYFHLIQKLDFILITDSETHLQILP